jgi:uncharacterized protein with FMN-binding domain
MVKEVIYMEEQQATPQTKKNNMKPLLAIIGLLVIVGAGAIAYQSTNNQNAANQMQTTPAVTNEQQTAEPTAAQQAAYKNGTYTAVGNYTSPGGQEELDVTVTLTDGVITDSTVEPKATRPISKTRQEDFAANYKTFVVGKSIDEVQLSKVSGSSLSPKGFNDALEKIKAEAQS